MNPNLYRLHEIHEIERGLNEEKLKHSSMIKKYHCLPNFCTCCVLIFQFCMFLLKVGFLSDFEEIIGKTYFWEGFTWNERVFCKCFNFSESS